MHSRPSWHSFTTLPSKCRPTSQASPPIDWQAHRGCQTWYTQAITWSASVAATGSKIGLGLRRAPGREYPDFRALRALCHVTAQQTQSGAQRLLALDQREEQARCHRVPRFSQLLALSLDGELDSFLSEVRTDTRRCEETRRQLEESADSAVGPATDRGSPALTSVEMDTLFTIRFQLAEAALGRILARSTGLPQACPAQAEGLRPSQQSRHPPPTAHTAAFFATCCRLTTEAQDWAHGTASRGCPAASGTTRTQLPRTKTSRNKSGAG